MAGGSDGDFALARYNRDGSLDGGFGSGGKARSDFGSGADIAFGMAVQADGMIVAAGVGSDDTALVRYNATGSLDASFGNGGRLTMDLGGWDAASAVAQRADGKIVAVVSTGLGDFTLVRLDPDGGLDESFGNGGKVTTDFASGTDDALDLAIQADGESWPRDHRFGPASPTSRSRATRMAAPSPSRSTSSREAPANPIQLSSRGVVAVAVALDRRLRRGHRRAEHRLLR